jgi:hypothetical protein
MHAAKSDFYKTKIKGEEFLVEKNYKNFLTPSKLWKKKQSKKVSPWIFVSSILF